MDLNGVGGEFFQEKGIVHIGEGGTPFLAEMGPGEHELIEQVEDIAAVHVEQTSLQPQKVLFNCCAFHCLTG